MKMVTLIIPFYLKILNQNPTENDYNLSIINRTVSEQVFPTSMILCQIVQKARNYLFFLRKASGEKLK